MKNKSTYSLLVNSGAEEKGRTIFEYAVYSLVILCTAVASWNFASSAVTLPGRTAVKQEAPVSMIANAPAASDIRG